MKAHAADAEIGWLVDLVSAVRSVRSEMNVPPAAVAPLVVIGANAATRPSTMRAQEQQAQAAAALQELARHRGQAEPLDPGEELGGDELAALDHALRSGAGLQHVARAAGAVDADPGAAQIGAVRVAAVDVGGRIDAEWSILPRRS